MTKPRQYIHIVQLTNFSHGIPNHHIQTTGSVGAGWDQLQRSGPKDDRQVTVGSEGKTEIRHRHFGADSFG